MTSLFCRDSIRRLAAALLQQEPHIHFVIVGDGVRKAELEEQVRSRRLANVEFMEFQPEARLPELRAATGVQLSLYRRGSSELSLPSKLYEIMASGKPLIASAEPASDIAALLEKSRSGLRIDPENEEQLVNAVKQLHGEAALSARMSAAGPAYVSAHHSLTAAADAYESLLISVAQKH